MFDRALLPLRLAHARRGGTFVSELEIEAPLAVNSFDLEFPWGEAAYNAIGADAGNTVHFAVSTKTLDAGARLFALAPTDSSPRLVADLDEALATPGRRTIPQGKVHVDLVPIGTAMVGATHIGYYDPRGDGERPGFAPGYAPYPGGWFFAVDDDRIEPLAQAPQREGIITMSADAERGMIFALTWPRGIFLTLDLASRTLHDHGPVFGPGETGSRHDGSWNRICRSIGIDSRSGAAFWTDTAGRIFRFAGAVIEPVAVTPRREMWRKVQWHSEERVFYGVLTNSALFRFDPSSLACEEIGSLDVAGAPATLAFALDADGRRIHAIVTGPGLLREDQLQLASTAVYLAVDLATGRTERGGPLRLADRRWVTQSQSLLIARGTAFSLCWVEVPARDRSPHARTIRRLRQDTSEARTRGYAEEIVLVSFPIAR
jgi:hypothetical protein